MARTQDIINPFFEKGWNDWTLNRDQGDNLIVQTDNIKYGLMSGYNSLGFPTAGNNYMLLARRIQIVIGTDIGTNRLELDTVTSYDLQPTAGVNIAAVDFGFVLVECTQASNISWGILGIPGLLAAQYSLPTTPGAYKQTIAWPVSSSSSALGVWLQVNVGTGNPGDKVTIDWISVDNFRVYPSIAHYTAQDANDASGVT